MTIKPAFIDRYIISQCLPYFGISVAVFTFIFLTHQLLDIMDFIVNYNIGIKPMLLMVGYSIPYFLVFIIPIATMLAVLLAFLQMSGDNEIVALKSSGVSVYRLLYPVLTFCICTCLLTAFMTIWALPRGKTAFKELAINIVTSCPDLGIEERKFNNNFKNMTLFVGEFDKKNRILADVFIEDRSGMQTDKKRKNKSPITIYSPTGTFLFDNNSGIFRLKLHNGVINQITPSDRSISNTRFNTYEVNLNLQQTGTGFSTQKDEKEMVFSELVQFVQDSRKKDERYISALLELYKKFSLPFACIALGVLALPLGVQARGRKATSGIGLSMGFFLIYYLLLSAGEILGESGRISPLLGMWMPDIVLGGLGIYLVTRVANDRSFKPSIKILGS